MGRGSTDRKLFLEALGKANDVLGSLGLRYWLDCGSLLGAIRESDFMAHDLDVDFGSWDWREAKKVKAAMEKAGFRFFRNHGRPRHGYEQRFIWKTREVRVDIFYFYPGTVRGGARIDEPNLCWQGSWNGPNLIVSEFPREIVEETVPYTFQGITVPVPKEFEAMLVARYGDWLTPVTEWDWKTDPKCIVESPPPAPLSDTTFLIKSFLRPELLMKAVSSIRNTYKDTAILVVDDGDISETYEQRLDEKKARLLRLPYDSGLSAGRNAGVKEIETTYTVVVDDDMIVTRDARVGDLLKLLQNADVVCGSMKQNGKIVNWEGTYEFPGDGGLKLIPFTGPYHLEQDIACGEVDFALNVLASRTEFLRTHPWDEQLKLSEHTSWFLGLKDQGARVLYAPGSVFEHKPVREPHYLKMRRRPEFRLRFFAKHGLTYHVGYNGRKDVLSDKDRAKMALLEAR